MTRAACMKRHAQVTVSSLGDAPEDGSVSSRHLLRNEPDPGRKIPASCECCATADRCNHRTRDDRADARHGHDPSTTAITLCQSLAQELLSPHCSSPPTLLR